MYSTVRHPLPRHRKDRDAHIIEWFKAIMAILLGMALGSGLAAGIAARTVSRALTSG